MAIVSIEEPYVLPQIGTLHCVILKTLLGLFRLQQYCQVIMKAWFWSDDLAEKPTPA